MDEQQLINMFENGTYAAVELSGKIFEVEIMTGFVDFGFSGYWTKAFNRNGSSGDNALGKSRFGNFKITDGVWNGYTCIILDYGPGFVSVKDYIRQVGPGTWLGVYEVGGHLKGWFRLREVVK